MRKKTSPHPKGRNVPRPPHRTQSARARCPACTSPWTIGWWVNLPTSMGYQTTHSWLQNLKDRFEFEDESFWELFCRFQSFQIMVRHPAHMSNWMVELEKRPKSLGISWLYTGRTKVALVELPTVNMFGFFFCTPFPRRILAWSFVVPRSHFHPPKALKSYIFKRGW